MFEVLFQSIDTNNVPGYEPCLDVPLLDPGPDPSNVPISVPSFVPSSDHAIPDFGPPYVPGDHSDPNNFFLFHPHGKGTRTFAVFLYKYRMVMKDENRNDFHDKHDLPEQEDLLFFNEIVHYISWNPSLYDGDY